MQKKDVNVAAPAILNQKAWKILRQLVVLTCLCAVGVAYADEEYRELNWDDLIPESEKAAWTTSREEALDDLLEQASPASMFGALVPELDKQKVKLPGFVVPLESDEVGMMSEFFLVPYFGACIHVPPPPPNQLVYVKLKEPFELKSLWDPFWIEGTLRTKSYESYMGSAGYTMEAGEISPYEWPE
ncbi:MAG: DUF3299 domain-containing protein [Pseudomonadota bacterium]